MSTVATRVGGAVPSGTATPRNTRSAIVSAAWRLFRQRGYEQTTIEDIIEAAGTARGTFYHHFHGKDALLSSLSDLFDDKYRELDRTLPASTGAVDMLITLNRELLVLIEDDVPVDLLSSLYSSQLSTRGDRHLLDRNRFYYTLLTRVVSEGQLAGELVSPPSADEIVRLYAAVERGVLYDWCIHQGGYSLLGTPADLMASFIASFAASPGAALPVASVVESRSFA